MNVQEGGVFQFFGGQMTSRDNVQGGGGAPGVPPIQVQTPPTPGWLATGLNKFIFFIIFGHRVILRSS